MIRITSDYGLIDLGVLYIGWNNTPFISKTQDYGDEVFGISINDLYAGCYAGENKWYFGHVDENGVLKC